MQAAGSGASGVGVFNIYLRSFTPPRGSPVRLPLGMLGVAQGRLGRLSPHELRDLPSACL